MTCFLKRLGPILLPFSAVIFTDKSIYRLPPSVTDLDPRRTTDNMKTTHTISATIFLSKHVDVGGALNFGGLGWQNISDGDREGEPDPEPTEIDKSWNSRIAFDIVSNLRDPSQLKGIHALQLQGELVIEVWSPTSFYPSYFFQKPNRELVNLTSSKTLQPVTSNLWSFGLLPLSPLETWLTVIFTSMLLLMHTTRLS